MLADAWATLGQRADVLNVRLGWVFRDGWITDERAWVVTVAQKLTPAELHAAGRALLPETFQGLPVEVTGPAPEDLLPADPLAEQPPDRRWLARFNREWHIVIEHAGLARTLAAHLRNDYEHNLDAVRGVEEALPAWPELLVAAPGAVTPAGMVRLTWGDYDAEG